MNEVCNAAVASNEKDGKVGTTFITPPDENGETDEDSAGEEEKANPGIVCFSRNMLEAEAEIVGNQAGNSTLNKKQKHMEKKQNKWRNGAVERLNNLQLLVTMKSQNMII